MSRGIWRHDGGYGGVAYVIIEISRGLITIPRHVGCGDKMAGTVVYVIIEIIIQVFNFISRSGILKVIKEICDITISNIIY